MMISIDPGFRSGTCIVDAVEYNHDAGTYTFNVSSCFEVHWNDRMMYFDMITASGKNIDAIIIESFKLTRDPAKLRTQYKSEMPAPRVIGLIETAAYSAGILHRIVYQEPADRYNVRVLPHHQSIVGLSDHNQAAYRHMHYYIKMQRNVQVYQ